jgi:hypothetical protein
MGDRISAMAAFGTTVWKLVTGLLKAGGSYGRHHVVECAETAEVELHRFTQPTTQFFHRESSFKLPDINHTQITKEHAELS